MEEEKDRWMHVPVPANHMGYKGHLKAWLSSVYNQGMVFTLTYFISAVLNGYNDFEIFSLF